jgi:hypothetical protein
VFFITPESVAVAATGDLIVGDATNIALIRVDRRTGDRTVISGPTRGSGVGIQAPIALTVMADTAATTGPVLRAVIAVDTITGHRAIVSGPDLGAVGAPLGIKAFNGRYYVSDPVSSAVFDPGDGTR